MNKRSVNRDNVDYEIKVYSTRSCLFCKSLSAYFKNKHIEYRQLYVDEDEDALTEMIQKSKGFTGVPYIVIKKEGCASIGIKGFDVNKINAVLEI